VRQAESSRIQNTECRISHGDRQLIASSTSTSSPIRRSWQAYREFRLSMPIIRFHTLRRILWYFFCAAPSICKLKRKEVWGPPSIQMRYTKYENGKFYVCMLIKMCFCQFPHSQDSLSWINAWCKKGKGCKELQKAKWNFHKAFKRCEKMK